MGKRRCFILQPCRKEKECIKAGLFDYDCNDTLVFTKGVPAEVAIRTGLAYIETMQGLSKRNQLE